ncbi:scoloptoxin SSD14-like [Periplaneta americana]|uniref:scoloptoxin SSD14-like n=1 Tax=Periplaneta americana TaxID=6978 RepID=UPI0037E88092
MCGNRKRIIASICIAVLLCSVALGLGLYFGLRKQGAVVTNGEECAAIGRNILERKGSAVEAAIAAMFCEGVVCSQSMGLGGGFYMTIYERNARKVSVLNARDWAPLAAERNMFNMDHSLSEKGGLAVAVPGELMGYWEAYQRYKSGNVEWRDLVQPSIDLCTEGYPVSAYLQKLLEKSQGDLRTSSLRNIFINNVTRRVWKVGDKIKRPQLAKTLEMIRDNNATVLYNGKLTAQFVNDIRRIGGIISEEDLKQYRVRWEEPVTAKLKNGITMYSVLPPGSGIILGLILNILDNFVYNDDKTKQSQRIVEAFKHAYGRKTRIGDPGFVFIEKFIEDLQREKYAYDIRRKIKDNWTSQDPLYYGAVGAFRTDHGTAHISVLAPNGDAVSVTSSINFFFGAREQSITTGIILNNGMRDFSIPGIIKPSNFPPLPNNYIEPKKRALSSMVPSIFLDEEGDVKLVVGAAGAMKITTATALVAMNVLWFNMTLHEAIAAPRLHHQLFHNASDMTLEYENNFPKDIIEGLQAIGHKTLEETYVNATVTGILKVKGGLEAMFDFRRGGKAETFYTWP